MMIRMKAMVLVATLSLGVLSSVVSASSGCVNKSALAVEVLGAGGVVASNAPSSLASVSADQMLPVALSAGAEMQSVGGISCASVLGLSLGILVGGLVTGNPLFIAAGGTGLVAASGCQD